MMISIHARPDKFAGVIDGLKAVENLDGILITVPHKFAVLDHIDRPSPIGRTAGSANAIRREADAAGPSGPTPMALGFDKLRFLKPVFFGDTLTTSYTIEAIDESRTVPRSIACSELVNQRGELTAVAQHINVWVPNSAGG